MRDQALEDTIANAVLLYNDMDKINDSWDFSWVKHNVIRFYEYMCGHSLSLSSVATL